MSFFCRLSRKHYWCTPHRSTDDRLVQVCYECGAERPVRELHNEFTHEKPDTRLTVYSNQSKAYPRVMEESPAVAIDQSMPPERIAVGEKRVRNVGEKRVRKFVVVK